VCGENPKSFNTSNLVQHLKSKHSEGYSKFLLLKQEKEAERADIRKEKSQRKSPTGLCQLTLQQKDDQSPWDINDFRVYAVYKKLGEMIATNIHC